jgi:hypothetical protein
MRKPQISGTAVLEKPGLSSEKKKTGLSAENQAAPGSIKALLKLN